MNYYIESAHLIMIFIITLCALRDLYLTEKLFKHEMTKYKRRPKKNDPALVYRWNQTK